MKNIFKSLFVLLCGAMLLASCQPKVELLATTVGTDATELTFDAMDAPSQSINVKADGDWVAITPDWIKVKPNRGSGNTTVTVKVGDNVDAIGIMGPRSGEITIAGTDVTSVITVNQKGNKKRDLRRDYVKATKINDGRAYLIASVVDGKILAASPLAASKTYGYLYDPIEVTSKDGKISVDNGDNGFLFTAVEGGGYYIQQGSDGRYLYQSGSYDSFNVTKDSAQEGTVWDVEFQSDGSAIIKNKLTEKFWQYSTSYSSWGCYAAAGKGEMPVLYEDTKVSVIEVLSSEKTEITVPSDSTHAQFTITTNVDWTVQCDSAWVKSYNAEGFAEEGNPTKDYVIDVTFDQWDNYDVPRTATFLVTGDAKDMVLTLTQEKKPAPSYPLPFEEKFDQSQGLFTINNVELGGLESVWKWASAQYGMKASAFVNKVNVPTESWLVSPALNLANVTSAVLNFDHVSRYASDNVTDLTVWASSDGCETWTQLKVPSYSSGKDWTFVNSGDISLKPFAGAVVNIAFKYVSTDAAAATWEVKNFKVYEGEPELIGIAGIRDAITSTSSSKQDSFKATLTDAIVSYVNGNNVYIEDATAGILLYKKSHGLVAGQKIDGKISGTGYVYNGLKEIAEIDLASAAVTDGATPYETLVTVEELNNNFDKYDSRRVRLEEITMQDGIAKDDRNGVVKQGDFTIAAYAKVNGPTIETEAFGDLVCWPVYNKTAIQVGIWDTEHFKSRVQADVCKIGTTLYPSLNKAIEDANNAETDVTIEMIDNYTMEEGATISNVNGKKVTLDLAGKVLTCPASKRVNVGSGTVDIITSVPGGIYDHVSESSNGIVMSADVTLTFGQGVTFIHSGTSAGIYTSKTGVTVNVNGATIISRDPAKNIFSMSKDDCNINIIEGSYVYGGISVTNTNITGGYFSAIYKAAEGYGFRAVEGVTKTVSGETYTFDFEVAKGVVTAVSKIGTILYKTLEDAVDAANAAEGDVTVELLSDYQMAIKDTIENVHNKCVTLDLKGHTLTYAGASSRLTFNGQVNIISTGSQGMITMVKTGSNLFMINRANSQINVKNIIIHHQGVPTVVTFYSKYDNVIATVEDCVITHNNLSKSYSISFKGSNSNVFVKGNSYIYGPMDEANANIKISSAYLDATTTSLADGATVKSISPVTLTIMGTTFSFGFKVQ